MLGPNGSGKSTALSLIAGLLRPDSGTRVAGRPGALRPRQARACARLGSSARSWRRPARAGAVAVPAPVRARQRRLRTTQRRPTRSDAARHRASTGWPRWTPRSTPTASRPSSPGARPSGSPSPARSLPTHGCSSSTSRWPRSTSPSHPPYARCCAGCSHDRSGRHRHPRRTRRTPAGGPGPRHRRRTRGRGRTDRSAARTSPQRVRRAHRRTEHGAGTSGGPRRAQPRRSVRRRPRRGARRPRDSRRWPSSAPAQWASTDSPRAAACAT